MSVEQIKISLVIPVYNEEETLPTLFTALEAVAPKIQGQLEYILIDDGSQDRTLAMLKEFHSQFATVKVVELAANAGQHAALMAGFQETEGDVIVTLDADLQNPPDEIPKLVAKILEDNDVAAGWRKDRQDPLSRRTASWFMNRIVGGTTGYYLHDYGCMLRAYSRRVVDLMNRCPERALFIPVLANSMARKGRVKEVVVDHAERLIGESKYSWAQLWRLNLDLLTGISAVPLHLVSVGGLAIAFFGLVLGLFLIIRRFIIGPEVEGVFTLFAILFFFTGVQIFSIGLIGEYITRIYNEVRARPRSHTAKVWVQEKGSE